MTTDTTVNTSTGGTGEPNPFDFLPPPTDPNQTDVVSFTTIQNGKVVGNLVFDDSITNSDDPNSSTSIMMSYQMPLQDGETLAAFTTRILMDLQSGDPQIIPNDVVINAVSGDNVTNIDEASLELAVLNYGQSFVTAALAQGKDPTVVATHYATVIKNLNPPSEPLTDDERNQLFVQLIVSEGNENTPVVLSNPTTKSIFDRARAELDLEEGSSLDESNSSQSGSSSKDIPSVFPVATNLNEVSQIYGQQFVQESLSQGIDPVAFVADATKAIAKLSQTPGFLDKITPPIQLMTQFQKVELMYQCLVSETGGIIPGASIKTALPVTRQELINDIVAQMKSQDTIQKSSLTLGDEQKVGLGGVQNSTANPWLSGTAMVALATCMYDVARKSKENQQIHGLLKTKTLLATMNLTSLAQKYAEKLFKVTSFNALMSAVAAGFSMAIATVGFFMSVQGMKAENPKPPPSKPEYLPTKSGSEQVAKAKAANKKMEQVDKKSEDAEAAVNSAKKAEEEAKNTLAACESRAKDPDAGPEDMNALSTAKEKAKTAKLKTEAAQRNQKVVDQERSNLRLQFDKDTDFRLESTSELQTRAKAHARANAHARNMQATGTALNQSAMSAGQVITSATSIKTSVEQYNIQAQQAYLKGWETITKTMLDKLTAAVSASYSDVESFLSTFKEIEQALNRGARELIIK